MDEERFISGIYNYCDRWCERCSMTSRCRLYADEQLDDMLHGPDSRDATNRAFWERMHGNYSRTRDMLEGMMAEQDIEMPTEEEMVAYLAEEEVKEARIDANPCAAEGEVYWRTVDKWFEGKGSVFGEKGVELEKMAIMDLPGRDPEGEAREILEAVEVIRWYQHQVYVKLKRALHSQIEEAEDGLEFRNDPSFPSDADGSARVALVGIDRSLAAWACQREHFGGEGDREEDPVFEIMLLLDRLRRRTEAQFPKAREFKRPGFDE